MDTNKQLQELAKREVYKNIFNIIKKRREQTVMDIYQYYNADKWMKEFNKYKITFANFTDFLSLLVYERVGSKKGKTFNWFYYPHSVADVALGLSNSLRPVPISPDVIAENCHVFFLRSNVYLKVPYDLTDDEQSKLVEFIKVLPTIKKSEN